MFILCLEVQQAFIQPSHLHILVSVLIFLAFLLSGILCCGYVFTLAHCFFVVQSVGFVIFLSPIDFAFCSVCNSEYVY